MSYLVYGFILLLSILMIVANVAVRKFFALKMKQQQEEELAQQKSIDLSNLSEEERRARVARVDKLLDEILEARRNGTH